MGHGGTDADGLRTPPAPRGLRWRVGPRGPRRGGTPARAGGHRPRFPALPHGAPGRSVPPLRRGEDRENPRHQEWKSPPTPFLDLSAQVSGASVGAHTNPGGDPRVSTFTVSSDPDVANSASELVLLAVPQPFNNHNGGMVVFGPDGDLYVGMGDGGSSGDPNGNAQNRGVLLGKILRVGVSGAGQLSVPSANPFVGQAGARPEIWSYGLRNPWRFSFDRQTGDLYIADVGQDAREEIDVSTAASGSGRGLDYGWIITEGTACYSPSSGCNRTGLTPPVLDYDHSQGCSITGGYVYRGSALPALRGTYFYGDYCGGWVRSFRLQGSGVTGQQEWTSLATGGHLTSFGEDRQGELYVIIQEGTVFRIAAATP